ncbi:MAG: response regulator [Verrucomicrobiota bacterium]
MPVLTEDATLTQLQESLIPAAETLRLEIEGFHAETVTFPEEEAPRQFWVDLEKLLHEACVFEEFLADRFSEETSGADASRYRSLRSLRHDARNQLNHLFGLVQLLQITAPTPEVISPIGPISEQLEVCLKLLSDAKPQQNGANVEAAEEAVLISSESTTAVVAIAEEVAEASHILIADDDATNRDILERLLAPNGFKLSFAENGAEALDLIEAKPFDAVLLDIQMPKIDGFGVLERLRETGHLRHTPVIVVTGLQEEQDAVRCIEIGAEDFLSRPIRPALLMARLNASLEKKRLREQVFEQHFTPELARELARNPDPMKMQARQARVTCLFCDIRGFSSISEKLGPSQTVDWLSGVMGEFSSIVIDHGGVLVDYTGDELLAMWGAPSEQPNHAELACRAALEIMARLPSINESWQPIVGAETAVGIGVNTGEALVGNIGTHRKFKYGPLGTVVNLASRVQGATRFLKTSLLITGDTAAELPPDLLTRRLCQVRVQNIVAPVDLHELESIDSPADWPELRREYEEALTDFEDGNFRRASAILGSVLLGAPNDGPGLQLMARVVEAMLNDNEDFSSIWTLPGK